MSQREYYGYYYTPGRHLKTPNSLRALKYLPKIVITIVRNSGSSLGMPHAGIYRL